LHAATNHLLIGCFMDTQQRTSFRLVKEPFRWEAVAHQPYKQDGSAPFKDISRQVLFHEDDLACDLVSIAAWQWHQFRANRGEPLGFLCMVNAQRDRPRLPTDADLASLKAAPAVARFLETS
jgi:hypothetical protein